MPGQPPLLDRELLVVTGKGGVGKTTVAAALAVACARAGRRVIACEVQGQARIPVLLGAAGTPGAPEREVAPGVWATTIDPERALSEWASSEVLPRPLVELLMRSSAFSAFVGAAPGARELVTATKAWELGRTGGARGERWTKRPGYDVVVLDAPASGHGLALLRTPRTFADIARVGPIAVQARRAAELVEDPSRSAVIAVARAEETPVNEALELEAGCVAALGHGPVLLIANGVRGDALRGPERERVAEARMPTAVASAVAVRGARLRVQDAQLHRLRRHAAAPVMTLPMLAGDEAGAEGVGRLADRLAAPLAADR